MSSFLNKLDEATGWRGRWLFVYGILPANLSLLGMTENKAKIADTYFLLLLFIPLTITFIYVRSKLATWYLTRDHLYTRSILMTFSIVTVASLICLLSINSNTDTNLHQNCIPKCPVPPIEESPWYAGWPKALAMGIGSATISSATLFSLLSGDKYFLGLPAKDFEAKMKDVKKYILILQSSELWASSAPEFAHVVSMHSAAKDLSTEFKQLLAYDKTLQPSLKNFRSLQSDIDALKTKLENIVNAGANYDSYWKTDFERPSQSLLNIKNLKI